MFESLESRTLMSATPLLGGIVHNVVGTVQTVVKVAAKVDVNAIICANVDAKVRANLGLCTTVKIDANADVNAIIGLCSKLSVNTHGVLCTKTGVAVDAKAILSILAKVGVQAKVTVDAKACLDVLVRLGLKVDAKINVTTSLNQCMTSLAQIGASLKLKI